MGVSFLEGGPVGRGGIAYDIVRMGYPGRTPWTVLRTPVCSYPIDVFHLSFNFLCLVFPSSPPKIEPGILPTKLDQRLDWSRFFFFLLFCDI
jgi:hypothetical protein